MAIIIDSEDTKAIRQKMYESFEHRRDALMELLDALTSNQNAKSVVELSLSPHFHRQYGSVFDAIDNYLFAPTPAELILARRVREAQLLNITAPYLPLPSRRSFWLFGTDATSVARQYAHTLADRTYVYQPNSLAGNKPVTIGHQYATIACLPEKEPNDPAWAIPMTIRRITSEQTETQIGAELVANLFADETLPWVKSGDLVVHTADSKYGTVPFLSPLATFNNLVNIARIRGNRVLYRLPPTIDPSERKAGRPRRYGERFDLKDSQTWHEPDEQVESIWLTFNGKSNRVVIEAWDDLIMRGKKDMPMHENPFRLVRIRVFKENGQLLFQRPLWLIVIGARRGELSLLQIWQAYRQRYDLEHFFRFGKQRLLMADFESSEVDRSENWMHLVQLAYVQLFMTRHLAENHPRAWERYLPVKNQTIATPTQAQRDFSRIIGEIGTPAQAPKVRGKSPGREKGTILNKKKRNRVIKKGKKGKKSLPKAA